MKVVLRLESARLVYAFTLEKGDGARPGQRARMARRECEIRLPCGWTLDDAHPDLIALSVLLLVSPFAARRIVMPRPVSQGLAEAASALVRLEVGPIDGALGPRRTPDDGVPGLAYSGGIDSTAAMAVLPKSTRLYFLDRLLPRGYSGLYSPEAAKAACAHLRSERRSVLEVKSDLEELRSPIGFPVDWANALPLVLLADKERIDSACFGTVLESAYRVGHERYLDFPERPYYKRWNGMFSAAGLPLSLPVAGLSEIATSKLVLGSPYRSVAQSCVRGRSHEPCLQCYKCFRKQLLQSILDGSTAPNDSVDRLLQAPDVRDLLLHHPLKHGNVIAYTACRYQGNHPVLLALRGLTRSYTTDTSWMERWYAPSIHLVPKRYRDHVKTAILSVLRTMSREDEQRVRSWHIEITDAAARTHRRVVLRALRKGKPVGCRPLAAITRYTRKLLRSRFSLWLYRVAGGANARWARGIRRFGNDRTGKHCR